MIRLGDWGQWGDGTLGGGTQLLHLFGLFPPPFSVFQAGLPMPSRLGRRRGTVGVLDGLIGIWLHQLSQRHQAILLTPSRGQKRPGALLSLCTTPLPGLCNSDGSCFGVMH